MVSPNGIKNGRALLQKHTESGLQTLGPVLNRTHRRARPIHSAHQLAHMAAAVKQTIARQPENFMLEWLEPPDVPLQDATDGRVPAVGRSYSCVGQQKSPALANRALRGRRELI
jgi:hypothetical protein